MIKLLAGGTLAATLNGLALAVAGVVVLQAILTFFALWMSTLFGQDLLSEAREHVVRTVLGLPLGKVESASTGDLVTRVTRDVSTMSMSVRFGLPEIGDRECDNPADRRRDAAELSATDAAAAGHGAIVDHLPRGAI